MNNPEQVLTPPLARLRRKKAALEMLMQPSFDLRRSLALDRAVLAIEAMTEDGVVPA